MKRSTKIILGIVIVLLVVVLVGGYLYWQALDKDSPKLASETRDLGFMTDREGQWDIFLRDPDGNLSNATADYDDHAYFFNFTFENEVINFYAADGEETKPAVVKTDGSDLKVLSFITAGIETIQSGNVDMDPAWSPDGEQIAWSKLVPGIPLPSVKLFLRAADSDEENELSGEGLSNSMLAWSPDGSKIAFTSDRGGDSDVYVIRVESGEVQKLADEGYNVQPVWSMDGETIMFISERDTKFYTGEFEFYLMNADGSDLHLMGEDEVFTGDPTYSPDGTQVAYMSNETGYWHIYLMDIDGSNVQQITEGDTNNLFPTWRPVPADQAEDEAADEGAAE